MCDEVEGPNFVCIKEELLFTYVERKLRNFSNCFITLEKFVKKGFDIKNLKL